MIYLPGKKITLFNRSDNPDITWTHPPSRGQVWVWALAKVIAAPSSSRLLGKTTKQEHTVHGSHPTFTPDKPGTYVLLIEKPQNDGRLIISVAEKLSRPLAGSKDVATLVLHVDDGVVLQLTRELDGEESPRLERPTSDLAAIATADQGVKTQLVGLVGLTAEQVVATGIYMVEGAYTAALLSPNPDDVDPAATVLVQAGWKRG